MISLIAAMAHGRVIGKANQLPWHLPADFAWFKQITMGKPIIMGRKTYESIGRPLPGRLNIVISRNAELKIDGVVVVSSVEQALAHVDKLDEVMIIGGASIYEVCLPLADRLYLTQIDLAIDGDAYFPAWGDDWTTVSTHQHLADKNNAHDMTFSVLERN